MHYQRKIHRNILVHICGLGLLGFLGGCFSRPPVGTGTDNPSNRNPAGETEVIDRRPIQARQMVLEDGDSLRVFLELELPRFADKPLNAKQISQEIIVKYGLLADYTSREFLETREIKLLPERIQKIGTKFHTYFNIAKRPKINEVMILEVSDALTKQSDQLDFLLSYTITKIRERFGLFNAKGQYPLFRNYLRAEDTVQIADVALSSQTLIVRYYAQSFNPAPPPMSARNEEVPRTMSTDSVFLLQTNRPIRFSQTGLYLIQEDTSNFYGLSIYVSALKYPKLSQVKEVIAPMIYITTSEELAELQNAETPKKALDKLWLKLMSGNTALAQQVIREYFQRIKSANQLYTTHKPGWQTDMGMIFVVFGQPTRIIRLNDKEIWIYTQSGNFSEMQFTFLRRPNQFSDYEYSLLRYPEYKEIWYPMIEQWRTGKVQ
ncbi:MAG: GWxTD domain-containing protein [Microscillaceae bacterium]|nr:GWxTD domain-containing protein [Microscillaceae bacterium]